MEINEYLSEKKYEGLFREHRKAFERLAYSYVRDYEEARDIVSNCFAKLWEKRHTLNQDSITGLMFISVRNACLDFRRSAKRNTLNESKLGCEGDLMDYYTAVIEKNDLSELFVSEILDLCRKKLDEMPEERREAFLKNRIEGLTYEEIAEDMGIPWSKVNKSIYSTLKELRIALKDYLAILLLVSLSIFNLMG